jgi:peroxiredoxin
MKKLLAIFAALLTGVGLMAQNPVEDLDLQYATDLLKAGTQAPEFTLRDIDGNTVKLSDFRGKDVVLVFWATWCPDCRGEIPQLKELYARADPAKVAFVQVSFDRKYENLCTFVKEKEVPGVHLFDPQGMKESAIGKAYGVHWIPSLYLIGPDGRVKLGTVVLDKIADAL